ncbi:hypothetical protein J6590_028656 [Homalodisca vitripennis]|nr:hypothetical protein J6590_028656 [Homalodisca vitripennis]
MEDSRFDPIYTLPSIFRHKQNKFIAKKERADKGGKLRRRRGEGRGDGRGPVPYLTFTQRCLTITGSSRPAHSWVSSLETGPCPVTASAS